MPKTILIADDEQSVRSSLERLLEFESYRVVQAADGPSALDLVRDRPVDLVLLDIKMPGMDGLEVLGAIAPGAPPTPRRDHIRSRDHSDRRRSHALGSLRLHREADRRRPHPAGDSQRTRAAAAAARERITQGRGSAADADRRRNTRRCCASSKRSEKVAPANVRVLIMGENGTGKEMVARALHEHEPARGRAVRRGQLRGDPGGADRERAVRPRAGFVHRCGGAARGQVRAGGRRNSVPRRGGGHEPVGAGQGAAGAAGVGVRTSRRHRDHAGRRAGHRRDQQGPPQGQPGGSLPGGPVLSSERRAHHGPAASRARVGHAASGGTLPAANGA